MLDHLANADRLGHLVDAGRIGRGIDASNDYVQRLALQDRGRLDQLVDATESLPMRAGYTKRICVGRPTGVRRCPIGFSLMSNRCLFCAPSVVLLDPVFAQTYVRRRMF